MRGCEQTGGCAAASCASWAASAQAEDRAAARRPMATAASPEHVAFAAILSGPGDISNALLGVTGAPETAAVAVSPERILGRWLLRRAPPAVGRRTRRAVAARRRWVLRARAPRLRVASPGRPWCAIDTRRRTLLPESHAPAVSLPPMRESRLAAVSPSLSSMWPNHSRLRAC